MLTLHLWNEHLPALPPGGPDLAWASRIRRQFLRSLAEVAGQIRADPRLAWVRAVGSSTAQENGPIRGPGREGYVGIPPL